MKTPFITHFNKRTLRGRSTCVGRPLGITDQVITTDFPSILDDTYITKLGFSVRPEQFTGPSYKRISHHYFRLRLLQSEILEVLQHRQAQKTHEKKRDRRNEFMHTRLSSPFLHKFNSFHAWREDIDSRLWDWKESAPLSEDTNVQFSIKFLELNYWQAVIMLYRQSLSVPPSLASQVEDVVNSMSVGTDETDDEDHVYLKIAEAGQQVLKLCTPRDFLKSYMASLMVSSVNLEANVSESVEVPKEIY